MADGGWRGGRDNAARANQNPEESSALTKDARSFRHSERTALFETILENRLSIGRTGSFIAARRMPAYTKKRITTLVKFFFGNAPRIIVIAPLLIFHRLTSSTSPFPLPSSAVSCFLPRFPPPPPPPAPRLLARGLFIRRSVGVFKLLHARATNPTCVARKNRERAADGRGKPARENIEKRLSSLGCRCGCNIIRSGGSPSSRDSSYLRVQRLRRFPVTCTSIRGEQEEKERRQGEGTEARG